MSKSRARRIALRIALYSVVVTSSVRASAKQAQTQEAPTVTREPTVDELRRRLDALEAGRRKADGLKANFSLARSISLPRSAMRARQGLAVVELVHDADRLGCFATFRPAAGSASSGDPIVRACMSARGREWILLRPGAWTLEFTAGTPGGRRLDYAPQQIRVDRDKNYVLLFGEAEEQRTTLDINRRARQDQRR